MTLVCTCMLQLQHSPCSGDDDKGLLPLIPNNPKPKTAANHTVTSYKTRKCNPCAKCNPCSSSWQGVDHVNGHSSVPWWSQVNDQLNIAQSLLNIAQSLLNIAQSLLNVFMQWYFIGRKLVTSVWYTLFRLKSRHFGDYTITFIMEKGECQAVQCCRISH